MSQQFVGYRPASFLRHDDSDRIIPMKKLVLSVAAVALLAGFAAGCAQPQKPAPAVVRKG